MSVNIHWEPVKSNPKELYTLAPQRFMESLRPLGWHDGGQLNAADMPALQAMAITFGECDPEKNPYTQLVNAIEQHGLVRVWATY